MRYGSLQKVTFTLLALLLAVVARAERPPVSTARQTYGTARSINPLHRLLFPAATYMLDDGTADDAVGLTKGGDLIALNEFAVIPGA